MSEHVSSLKMYWAIFATLLILTGVTVAVAYIDLGPINTVIALGIAAFKASLVVLYFMHLRWGQPLTKVFWVAGLMWLMILLVLTMNDYVTRPWQVQPEGWTESAPAAPAQAPEHVKEHH